MIWALSGASVLALVTGILPVGDGEAVLVRIWPIMLFLVAVTIVAELADSAGLFEVAADLAARAGRGRVLMLWFLVVALAALTTVLLSLDTTAVLLTPVVLALAERLGLAVLPFAMTTVWLANTASLLLPVSNLTNLLAIEQVRWSAATWASRMWAPAVTGVLVTVLVLWLVHRRALGGSYRRSAPPPVGHRGLLITAAVACVGLGIAVAAGAPPWAAAGSAAIVLVVAFRIVDRAALGAALLPWRLVVTTVGIFLVVAAVQRHGLGAVLHGLAGPAGRPGDVRPALRSAATGALASNVVNNLPAYLATEPAVSAGPPGRLLALVIGTNGGPLITVWGSLATVLWRERCAARGVVVPAGRFALHGVLLVIPMVAATTGVLLWSAG